MSEKVRRQMAIKEMLVERVGSTQEDIRRWLIGKGVRASQATLSRDLRELGAVKIPGENGSAVYRLEGPFGSIASGFLGGFTYRSDPVNNLLVLHTSPGIASGFCAQIDRQGWPEVVGTIAGDDTILIITRSVDDREAVERKLKCENGE